MLSVLLYTTIIENQKSISKISMFTSFQPKRRKVIGVASHDMQDGSQIVGGEKRKSKELSAMSRALQSLNGNNSFTTIIINDSKKELKRIFKNLDLENRQQIEDATLLRSMAIEANFNISQFQVMKRSTNSSFTSTITKIDTDIIINPNWIFPSCDNTTLFSDNDVAITFRKHLNRREFWPTVDLSDHSSQMIDCARIKILAQQWQEALFAVFQSYITGTTNGFQILGDSASSISSSNSSKQKSALNTFYLSASFFHLKQGNSVDILGCTIVGASKPFLKRLLTLGAEPFIILEDGGKAPVESSDLSAAGRLENLKAGKNLYLTGKGCLSIVIHTILEQVFFPGGTSSLAMFVDSLPIIRSSSYFCHSVPSFLSSRAIRSAANSFEEEAGD